MKEITRNEAIESIREVLVDLADEKTSVCEVASRLGIFCKGLDQWDDRELRRRHTFMGAMQDKLERKHLEKLALRRQLCRQNLEYGWLPCDIFPGETGRTPCGGWSDFYETEIAEFYRQLVGDEVCVVPGE
jgi:hypothetical protein